jgi:hypothetical protein
VRGRSSKASAALTAAGTLTDSSCCVNS